MKLMSFEHKGTDEAKRQGWNDEVNSKISRNHGWGQVIPFFPSSHSSQSVFSLIFATVDVKE